MKWWHTSSTRPGSSSARRHSEFERPAVASVQRSVAHMTPRPAPRRSSNCCSCCLPLVAVLKRKENEKKRPQRRRRRRRPISLARLHDSFLFVICIICLAVWLWLLAVGCLAFQHLVRPLTVTPEMDGGELRVGSFRAANMMCSRHGSILCSHSPTQHDLHTAFFATQGNTREK